MYVYLGWALVLLWAVALILASVPLLLACALAVLVWLWYDMRTHR